MAPMIETTTTRPLRLPASDDKDEQGGYVQGSLDASHGYRVATYLWEPECGMVASKAVVFHLHGIIGHALFGLLEPDEKNHRTLLRGSFVEQLLELGVTVVSHDHPAHGRSTGLHCYVESLDHLRDVSVDVIEHFRSQPALAGKKIVVTGESMGGTTAIRICATRPDLVDAYVLLSPAVRLPDNMFGPYGKFLKAISPVLKKVVPKLPVLKLPPSPDPKLRDAIHRDGLSYRGAIRVHVGTEFLRVYSEINETAHTLQFKSVLILIGGKDIVVSPSGIQSFVDRVNSEDKHVHIQEDIGHELFREKGYEAARQMVVDWIAARL